MLNPSEALEQARRMFPGVVQGVESIFDLPCPINVGEFIPTVRPMVYFKADSGKDWDTCLFCMFWWKDTAAPHQYDFTGWIDAKGKHAGEPPVRVMRRHWEYWMPDDMTGSAVYSAGDHNPVEITGRTEILYQDIDFCNMEDPRFQRWAKSDKSIFGDAVTAPWQWSDPVIKKAGLIWREPAQFIELALKYHEKGVL